MIEVSQGSQKAKDYKPSEPSKAGKLTEFYNKWREVAQKVAVLNSDKLLEEIEDLDKLLPDTTMNAVLRNYYNLKYKEKTRIDACVLNKKIINKVVICFDEMSLTDRAKNCICTHCGNTTHIQCKLRHMWEKRRAECEHCRGVYNDVSELYWDSYRFIQISEDKMVPLTWKDVFNKVYSI